MSFSQSRREKDCNTDPETKIYSDAKYVEEAGDVIGLELALKPSTGEGINALLYIYEGAPTMKGISLRAILKGKTLVIDETSSEHSFDSSGKDVVHELPIKISGTLEESEFAGSVQINGGNPETVVLRRVPAIWLCTSKM